MTTKNTEQTKALAEIKIEGNFPVNIRNMEDMKFLGSMLATSGYFKEAKQVSQAIVKVIAGAEIGIGPVAAMSNIHIIKGKPSFSSNLIGSQIKRHPRYDYKVISLTETLCDLEFYEDGERIGEYSFAWADAEKAGLSEKDNWKNYPRSMLFARCVSAGARVFCPDVFYSHIAYTPEELDPNIKLDASGEIIEGSYQDALQQVGEPTETIETPEAKTEPPVETPEAEAAAPVEHYPPGRPWMDNRLGIPDARNVLYGIAVVEWGYENEDDVRMTVKDANRWTGSPPIPDNATLDQIANFLMAEAPNYAPPIPVDEVAVSEEKATVEEEG